MQDDRGLKSILALPALYAGFQRLVGADRGRRLLVRSFWRFRPGDKVVDVGCGPGVLLGYFPESIDYVGFDISEAYIETARRRWGERGTFLHGSATDFLDDGRFAGADVVMCTGLLHHLEDGEVMDVFRFARRMLAPGGRFLAVEPTMLVHMSASSRWFMGMDRGRNVRQEAEWRALFGRGFECVESRIATGLIRLPYIHILIEAHGPTAGDAP